MSGDKIKQSLKALKRAPHGTLAFRSYLLLQYSTVPSYKVFGRGLMSELLTGRKRVKVE